MKNKTYIYNDGYDAGWNGAEWSQNPYLTNGDTLETEDAKAWERGRFDGHKDRSEVGD